jgi:hypothetical protein
MTREEAIEIATYCLDSSQKTQHINQIYDNFESRTCANCRQLKAFDLCEVFSNCIAEPKTFGCNKFTRK